MTDRDVLPPSKPETRTFVSTTALSIKLLPDLLDQSGNLPLREGSAPYPSINPSQEPIYSVSPRLPLQSLDKTKLGSLGQGIDRPFYIP